MASEAIQIKHLQKNYGAIQALSDVTFSVHPGESFGFIGPNGAGKSTTLRTLLGLIKASGGRATIFGHDVWTQTAQTHAQLAYVPGDVYLWPHLTGKQIIDFLLRLHHQTAGQRVTELVNRFKLDVSKPAHSYSKGNRQKVALVAALASDVPLYLFDEPTSGLDPLMEAVFQDELQKLKQTGKTVLLSSHIMSEVARACDRIGIIREGRMVKVTSLTAMQQTAHVKIMVTTATPIDPKEWPGVHLATPANGGWQLAVAHDQIGTIVARLAAAQVTNLTVTPPSLDDLFLHYYQQGAK